MDKRHRKYWDILFAEPPEIVPFSFGSDVVNQGNSATLTCSIQRGDAPISITWSLKGDIVSSDPTMKTTMIGDKLSFLVNGEVGYRHSGMYTCRASNPAGSVTYSTELKVNGKWIKGTGSTGIFYLQNRRILFHLHLGPRWSMRVSRLH